MATAKRSALKKSKKAILRNKAMIVWALGMISGFTLMISGYTLNYWLSIEEIDIKTIGFFSLISLPYAINFTWAPILDTMSIPFLSNILGHRLSWLLVIQTLLCIFVYSLGTFSPVHNLSAIAFVSFLVSFLASAQDAILGAMKTELIEKEDQGRVAGMYIFGYRIGMLISSSGAIYLAQILNWNLVYQLFSLIIIFFHILLIYLIKRLPQSNCSAYTINYDSSMYERPVPYTVPDMVIMSRLGPIKNKNVKYQIFRPSGYFPKFNSFCHNIIGFILKPIGSTKYILLILAFLVLYRLPDNFISMMITPFLHSIGYNGFEIATAGKFFGTISAMIGGFIASYIMRKKSLYSSLLLFGSIHAFAHILYIVQYACGKNIYLLFIVTWFEGTTCGMTMAAYIAFISSLCTGKFRATQYSFFSSMMGLSRSIFPSISGYIVANFGWAIFYTFTIIASIPALVIMLYLTKIKKYEIIH